MKFSIFLSAIAAADATERQLYEPKPKAVDPAMRQLILEEFDISPEDYDRHELPDGSFDWFAYYDTQFVPTDWRQYYMNKLGVTGSEYDQYSLGGNKFDWDSYYADQAPEWGYFVDSFDLKESARKYFDEASGEFDWEAYYAEIYYYSAP